MGAGERIQVLIDAVLNNDSVRQFVAGVKEGAEEAAREVANAAASGGDASANASKKSTAAKKDEKSAVSELKGELGGMIAQYFALSTAISFVGDSFKSAIAEQKLNEQVAGNMAALTGATEAQTAATLAWLDAAELASGVDKSELVPALTNLAAATGDLGQAQELANISAGAAARGIGTLTGNANVLAAALETGVIPKKTAFGKALANAAKETGSLDGAIKKLNGTYGDAGSAVSNAGMETQRAGIQWDNAKESIGGIVQKLVLDLLPAIKWVAMAIAGAVGTVKLIISAFTGWFEIIGAVAGLLVNVATGNWKGALTVFREQVAETKDKFVADFESVGDSINAVEASFDRMNAGAVRANTAAAGGVFKPRLEKPGGGDETKVAVDFGGIGKGIQGEDYEARVRREQKASEEILENRRLTLELESKSEEEYTEGLIGILEEREALYTKGSSEQLKIAIERKKAEEKLETDSAKKKEKASLAWKRAAATGDIKYFSDLKKSYETDLKKFKGTIAEKKKLEQGLHKIKLALLKAYADKSLKYGRAGVEAGRAAFGDKKSLAIAEAVMNTYDAATAAWSNGGGFPVGAIFAALTVAGGLAEIAQINKADPSQGSGFDDPQNDIVAELGGQRWARDFTNKFSSGVMRGMGNELSGGAGGGATNYNYNISNPGSTSRTTNVNVGSMPLVDTGRENIMRDLASNIRTYMELDKERDIR